MSKYKLTSSEQIRLGALLSYFSIFLNIGAGIIYTPWMIRHIGRGEYGLFTLANSLISLFMIDFGLSAATSKYVSEFHVKNEEEKVNYILGAIYKLYIIADLVIFITLTTIFFFIDDIYINLSACELEQFKVVYCIAGLYSVVSFPFITTNGILTAYEKFFQLKMADVIYRILVILFMVIALLNGKGLYALVTINAVVGLLIIAYKLFIIKKSTPVKVRFKHNVKGVYKEVFGFSFWSTIASLAQRLIFNVTPSILGMVASASEIAVFGIVTTIESYTFTITNAINGMFMTKISKIYTENNGDDKIMNLMLKVGKFQYLLNGILVIGFLVLGKNFITLWMGKEYIDAYYGIVLVLTPGLLYNPMQIAHTAMVVRNKVKKQAKVNIFMGILNVIFSYTLSKKYGVIGACMAICFAYSFRVIALILIYKKDLALDMTYFIKKCYVRYLPIFVITAILGYCFLNVVPSCNWFGLIINSMFIVFVYFAIFFILGMNDLERKKVKDLLIKNIK